MKRFRLSILHTPYSILHTPYSSLLRAMQENKLKILSNYCLSALGAAHFILGAEHFLVEFADAGFGDGVDEDDIVGEPPLRHEGGEIFDDLFFSDFPHVIGFGYDAGEGALGPYGMGNAYDAGFQHFGMAHY